MLLMNFNKTIAYLNELLNDATQNYDKTFGGVPVTILWAFDQ